MDEKQNNFNIKIIENSAESETIMEGFIGLPKDDQPHPSKQQDEKYQFEHCNNE